MRSEKSPEASSALSQPSCEGQQEATSAASAAHRAPRDTVPELCPCHLPACTHLPPSAGRAPGLHGTAGDERLESVCFTFNPPFTTTRRGGPSPCHHPPSLVTQPKNFNLHGLSVVVKYNTNGAGLVYPEAMKLLSEEIDTHY